MLPTVVDVTIHKIHLFSANKVITIIMCIKTPQGGVPPKKIPP